MNSLYSKKTKPPFDFWTGIPLLLLISGQFILFYEQQKYDLHPFYSLVFATLLMNLSFTVWHECAHGNFSRFPWINNSIGILASFLSLGPNYFHRKQEHLIHHRWEGDPENDPVFPRLQTNFWNFPFRLMQFAMNGRLAPDFEKLLPLSPLQKTIDRALSVLSMFLLLFGFAQGYGTILLCVWIVPRILSFFLHAYYICYFPHSIAGGGFQKYRVYKNRLLSVLTMNQNFHGVHHLQPTVPWHQYPALFSELQKSKATVLHKFEILS